MSSENVANDAPFTGKIKWTGGRTWEVWGESDVMVPGGSPVRFGGKPGYWSPEDFYLASLNTCLLGFFLYIARSKKLQFVSYESEIEGGLDCHIDKDTMCFTEATVRPKVVIKKEDDRAEILESIQEAHDLCYIGNSVCAKLVIEPEITVADGE